MRDGSGELASCAELAMFFSLQFDFEHTLRQSRTQETRDLTDDRLRGKEGMVLVRKLLDELLVTIELFQVLNGHGVNAQVLRTVNVMLITKNAINRKQSATE